MTEVQIKRIQETIDGGGGYNLNNTRRVTSGRTKKKKKSRLAAIAEDSSIKFLGSRRIGLLFRYRGKVP